MAPTLISDAGIAGMLKRVYESYRTDLFPRLTPLMSQLKRGKSGGPERMRWGGAGVYWDVVVNRPVGASFSDAGYFPPHTAVTEAQASVGVKRNYVTREVDALALHGARGSETSFVPLIKKITQEAMDAGRLSQQEALHGAGTGVKGICATRTSATEITVTEPYGVASLGGQGGLLLDVGMSCVALDANDSYNILTTSTVPTITAITHSGDTATVTFSSSIEGSGTIADGDYIVLANTITDTSYNQVPDGLIKITNRGNSYKILDVLTPDTYPRWDAIRMAAGTDTPDAAQITEMDIYRLIQKVAQRSGKDAKLNPNEFLLMTTPGLELALAESLVGQRRFESKEMTLNGGFKAVEICGLPLISDQWCPVGTVYLIHKPSLAFVDMMDFVKLAYEGEGPWRFLSGRDAYQVNFGAYWNTATINRAAHGSITGYTDSERFTFVM